MGNRKYNAGIYVILHSMRCVCISLVYIWRAWPPTLGGRGRAVAQGPGIRGGPAASAVVR